MTRNFQPEDLNAKEAMAGFDAWLDERLREHLQWPSGLSDRAKRLSQARCFVDLLCHELARRKLSLEAPDLAKEVEALLAEIGTAQREGRINNLWAYIRARFMVYVGGAAVGSGPFTPAVLGRGKLLQALAGRFERRNSGRAEKRKSRQRRSAPLIAALNTPFMPAAKPAA